MIEDIGKLMGLKFDEETISAIHNESGGYPFTARQLASLLYNKLATEGNKEIHWSSAQRYLKNPLIYSSILKNYFKQNIWADLQKRNFASAMAILKLLACNQDLDDGMTKQAILARLKDDFTESECMDALLWLEAMGLVRREEAMDEDYFYLQVRLLSRWLQMEMKPEEIHTWQLSRG